MKIKYIDIEGMYSYLHKQRINLDDKNFIVGPNNSGKSVIFKAVNFFINSLINGYDLRKPWNTQSNPEMTLGISLNDFESRYLVELLTISGSNNNKKILAPYNIVEFFIDKFKNIEISLQWTGDPFSNNAKLKNFSMKILDLDIKVTHEENHGVCIHKSDDTICGIDRNPNAFILIIKKIGIKQFTKNTFLNMLDSRYMVHTFPHMNLFENNVNHDVAERIKFILNLSHLNMNTNMELTFLHMLGHLFKQKISFISEKRQFKMDNDPKKLPLSDDSENLQSYLYWLKNSQELHKRNLYGKIQDKFSKIMGDENMLFDVSVAEKHESSIIEKKTIQPGNVSIMFRNNNEQQSNTIKFMESGSGIREILFLLAKYFDTEKSVIFMDEPAMNLHPTLIKKLMREIFSKGDEQNQLIIITHSPTILSNTKLLTTSNIIRISKNKTSIVIQPSIDNKKWIINQIPIFHLLKLDVLFSKGVILVEGPSDVIFFNALLDRIRDLNYYVDDIMIIGTGGSKSMKKFGRFMHIFEIPFLSLIDKDAPGVFKQVTELSSNLKMNKQDFHDENTTYMLNSDLENYMMNLNESLYNKIKDKFRNNKLVIAYNFSKGLLSNNDKKIPFHYMLNHLKYIIEKNI